SSRQAQTSTSTLFMTSISLPLPETRTSGGFLTRIIATSNDPAAFVLRVALGVVMLPHGAQKLLGWFGGNGFEGTMGFFTGSLGVPYVIALLAIIAEFFGAIGLITGLLSRVAALGIAAVMAVAAYTVHLPNGFFMNWTGQQQGEGFEFHILAFA